VAGDWDGNGSFTPGIVMRDGAVLRWSLRNSNTSGAGEITFAYGDAGMIPIVGDWDGNGTSTPGAVSTTAPLRWFLRNSNTSGVGDIELAYGDADRIPIVGDWDANGTSTPGAIASTGLLQWSLRNSNTTGTGDIEFTYPGLAPQPVEPAPQPAPTPQTGPAVGEVRVLFLRVVNVWTWDARSTRLRRLSVRGLPTRAAVKVRCRGRGCPYKHRTYRARRGRVQLQRPFRRRHLAPGTRIRLQIDMPRIGRHEVRFRVRAGAVPRRTDYCPSRRSQRLRPCP
jgi:hypothetical protein